MKIGILGSGDVGQALGRGFLELGHEVKIGTRNIPNEKLNLWLESNNKNATIGTFEDTTFFGEIIIIAIKGSAVENAIKMANPNNFANKMVIDVSNPIEFSKEGKFSLFIGGKDSLGELIQRSLPKSKIVKCWNIVPNFLMIHPNLANQKPTMIICGNDQSSKSKMVNLLEQFGWNDIIDIGEIDGSRYLESLTGLWVRVSMVTNTYNHAFKDIKG